MDPINGPSQVRPVLPEFSIEAFVGAVEFLYLLRPELEAAIVSSIGVRGKTSATHRLASTGVLKTLDSSFGNIGLESPERFSDRIIVPDLIKETVIRPLLP